tara:strand:- start:80 stop:457 length:378 start_codon:yes stop_codon:yes gene_type:complete
MFKIFKLNFSTFKAKYFLLIVILCIFSLISLPKKLIALDTRNGESLFKHHCAGCHVNGGNIIRRSKNLKISSLKRNGIDDPELIAKIAREGIGIMDGYGDLLVDNDDLILANWILEQAQKAWVQG